MNAGSIKTAVVLLGLLHMSIAAQAPVATAPETLAQLIAKLAVTPSDNALREQVIKRAVETKPAPAVPEEARKAFVQASIFAKEAKDAAGQKLAIESFQKALLAAPWWSDAYHNLAIVQELAGQFTDARASLNWYIKTNPGEKEARAAQDKICH